MVRRSHIWGTEELKPPMLHRWAAWEPANYDPSARAAYTEFSHIVEVGIPSALTRPEHMQQTQLDARCLPSLQMCSQTGNAWQVHLVHTREFTCRGTWIIKKKLWSSVHHVSLRLIPCGSHHDIHLPQNGVASLVLFFTCILLWHIVAHRLLYLSSCFATFSRDIIKSRRPLFVLISSLAAIRLNPSYIKQSYYASIPCIISYFGPWKRTRWEGTFMQKVAPLHFDCRAGRLQTKPTYVCSTVGSVRACRPSLVTDALAPMTVSLIWLISIHTAHHMYCICAVIFLTGNAKFPTVTIFARMERFVKHFADFRSLMEGVCTFFLRVLHSELVDLLLPTLHNCLHAAVRVSFKQTWVHM